MVDPSPRVIKRYANRKLYDTSCSRYVTHSDVAELVRAGTTVQIIDKDSGEDLTRATLAHILFQEEKSRGATVPFEALKGIIQSGGEYLQRRLTEPVSTIREEAEARVEAVKRTLKPGQREEPEQVDFAPPSEPEGFREWLDNTHKAYETLQRTLEDRWRLATNVLDHVDRSRKRIEELEARIEVLEKRLADSTDTGES